MQSKLDHAHEEPHWWSQWLGQAEVALSRKSHQKEKLIILADAVEWCLDS